MNEEPTAEQIQALAKSLLVDDKPLEEQHAVMVDFAQESIGRLHGYLLAHCPPEHRAELDRRAEEAPDTFAEFARRVLPPAVLDPKKMEGVLKGV